MTNLLQDLRYGLRSLAKAPAFATAAIAALALGIGATTAIFSVVNAVVLEPLPYAHPDRLVSLWEVNHEKNLDHEPLSPVNFMDYRGLNQVFADAAAWWRPEVTLRDADKEPVRVNTIEVSGNFLTVLGVQPTLGAGFPADVFFSRDRLVLMSDRLWRSRYSADPAIVGKTISMNANQFTVAGVLPRGFGFPGDTDLWQLLTWDPALHSRARPLHGGRRANEAGHDGGRRAARARCADRSAVGRVRGLESRLALARDSTPRRGRRATSVRRSSSC